MEGLDFLKKLNEQDLLRLNKKEIFCLLEKLSLLIQIGELEQSALKKYIINNHESPQAGLVSSVLCMINEPLRVYSRRLFKTKSEKETKDEIFKRNLGLSKSIKVQIRNLRKLTEAYEIAYNEKYGFFAYEGEYLFGLKRNQGRFAKLRETEKNYEESLYGAEVIFAHDNGGNSLKNAIINYAYNNQSGLKNAKVETSLNNSPDSLIDAVIEERLFA